MANLLAPVAKAKFFGNNGQPANGYKLFTYAAGSSTKLATYTDSTTGTPNTNPVILDFRGEASIWIPPNIAYKFIFSPPSDTDPPTAPIWTVDHIVDSQLVTLYGGVDTGIANAYVLNFVSNFTAYADGIAIFWIPSHTNTGASTINVNGLGPVAITNQDGSALAAGQIQANQIAQILYKGTGFILLTALSVITTGTFSATFNGFSSPLIGNISYSRFGSIVTLSRTITLQGTSNSVAMSWPNGTIPVGLRPSAVRSALCSNLIDNSNSDFMGKITIDTDGSIDFYKQVASLAFSNAGFTAANNKGLLDGWQISYTL